MGRAQAGTRSKFDIVSETFERWSRGDREVRKADVHPEAVVVSQLANRTYHGYAGIRQWTEEVLGSFDEWEMEIEQRRELPGDGLLVIGTVHLRGRSSGVDLEAPCGWLFDFRDGRMARLEIFLNRVDEALAAAARRELGG